MANQSHEIFSRIILHNNLMPEAELQAYLKANPDPINAAEAMVQMGKISGSLKDNLMGIYKKQMAQVAGQQPATAAAPAPAAAPQAGVPATPKSAPATAVKGAGSELVFRLFKVARDAGASDLHIKSGACPVVRINSVLHDLKSPIDPEVCKQSLLSLLTPEQKESFLEKEDIDFAYDAGPELGRYRTNFLMQQRGMDGIFRLIPNKVSAFEELGLPDQVKRFTDYAQGIVLITGPKNSGKTTTLAAMVDKINTERKEHVITVEDPIEFVQPSKGCLLSQREVGTHTKSFANALRAGLREAPDVIIVGEMRDLETTSLSITAAETGHLVLASMHTPNAIRTIGRVLDVFPPKEQGQIRSMISESLRGVVSQQLVPSPDGKRLELALEIMVNTPAAGNLIREDRTFQLQSVMQTGKKLGMIMMDESLANLVNEGRITKEEALTRVADPTFFLNQLD
ncbi:MAG: PilT/PilU family type 4a pilus ATPase [Planctomycetota bacterium]|jgi:twitching motility protein PilT|nr:PilT/PilU family type 4a pilus ATPase [Planctomycetota bacterium]MDP7130764.1 PilT/PilU family type 4a pilus ATPase [Planctomycetota bacterium]